MCAYNAQAYLEESVTSVLEQSYQDLELIIVDDGSTDDTYRVALALSKADHRIRLIRHETNRGLATARNRTLAESRGQYFAVADADDIHLKERLAEQVALLNSESRVGVVGSQVSFFGNPTGQPPRQAVLASDQEIKFAMLFHPAFWNTTTVYRTELVRELGGYRTCFDRGAEDYDLWCRLSSRTMFANVTKPLVRVRLHPASITSGNDDCLSNILEISRYALGDYLGIPVLLPVRRAFHELLNQQSMNAASHRIALPFLRQLLKILESRTESPPVKHFLARLANAVWIQAEYEVYRNPTASDEYFELAKRMRFVPDFARRGRLAIRRFYRHFRNPRADLVRQED
jgi:glycosyltransferase involved in cell wall biosynthesis